MPTPITPNTITSPYHLTVPLTELQVADLLNTIQSPPETLVNYAGFTLPSGLSLSNTTSVSMQFMGDGSASLNLFINLSS